MSLREAIGEHRFFTNNALQTHLSLRGLRNARLTEIDRHVISVLDQMADLNSEYINIKRRELGNYLAEVPENRVEEAYKTGLDRTVRTRFEILKQVGQDENLENEEYLAKLIIGYSFDFYRALRISKRMNIAPLTALEIAKKTYINPPNVVHQLANEFSQFSRQVITETIAHRSFARDALSEMKAETGQLTLKYPRLPKHVIQIAALSHRNPDKYLEQYQKTFLILKEAFPEFENIYITRAIVDYSDPNQFLINARQRLEVANDKYPNIPGVLLRRIVILHQDQDEIDKRIGKYLSDYESFTSTFPDAPRWCVWHALLYESKDNKIEFLSIANRLAEVLKAEFGNYERVIESDTLLDLIALLTRGKKIHHNKKK